MSEGRPPAWDFFKSLGQQVFFTMLFPVASSIGVAIESKSQGADRVVKSFLRPVCGPLVLWKSDPCLDVAAK